MNRDLLCIARELHQEGLSGVARDVLQLLLSRDRNQLDAWQLLLSLTDSASQRLQCLSEICRLQPDNAQSKETYDRLQKLDLELRLATEPEFMVDDKDVIDEHEIESGITSDADSAQPTPPKTSRAFFGGKILRPSVLMRITVWAAVLVVIGVMTMAWMINSSAEFYAEYDVPMDLLSFLNGSRSASDQSEVQSAAPPAAAMVPTSQLADLKQLVSMAMETSRSETAALANTIGHCRSEIQTSQSEVRLLSSRFGQLTDDLRSISAASQDVRTENERMAERIMSRYQEAMDLQSRSFESSLERQSRTLHDAISRKDRPVSRSTQPLQTEVHRISLISIFIRWCSRWLSDTANRMDGIHLEDSRP